MLNPCTLHHRTTMFGGSTFNSQLKVNGVMNGVFNQWYQWLYALRKKESYFSVSTYMSHKKAFWTQWEGCVYNLSVSPCKNPTKACVSYKTYLGWFSVLPLVSYKLFWKKFIYSFIRQGSSEWGWGRWRERRKKGGRVVGRERGSFIPWWIPQICQNTQDGRS